MKLKQPYMKQTKYTFLRGQGHDEDPASSRLDWTPRKGVSRDELSHSTSYNSRKISALVAMLEKLAIIFLLGKRLNPWSEKIHYTFEISQQPTKANPSSPPPP